MSPLPGWLAGGQGLWYAPGTRTVAAEFTSVDSNDRCSFTYSQLELFGRRLGRPTSLCAVQRPCRLRAEAARDARLMWRCRSVAREALERARQLIVSRPIRGLRLDRLAPAAGRAPAHNSQSAVSAHVSQADGAKTTAYRRVPSVSPGIERLRRPS
eukprot:834404-Prymnesium_polylepis.1